MTYFCDMTMLWAFKVECPKWPKKRDHTWKHQKSDFDISIDCHFSPKKNESKHFQRHDNWKELLIRSRDFLALFSFFE